MRPLARIGSRAPRDHCVGRALSVRRPSCAEVPVAEGANGGAAGPADRGVESTPLALGVPLDLAIDVARQSALDTAHRQGRTCASERPVLSACLPRYEPDTCCGGASLMLSEIIVGKTAGRQLLWPYRAGLCLDYKVRRTGADDRTVSTARVRTKWARR